MERPKKKKKKKIVFFFNDTEKKEIYTLSLKDALQKLEKKTW